MTLDAQGACAHGGAGFRGHVRYNLDGRMAGDAQAVVRSSGKLVLIRAWSMHIVTIRAGLERGAVTVFLGLDEIRILLMVLLRVFAVGPQFTGGA